ncbi:MAG: hypothetical protein FWG45_05920 [Oscillospiraceae bacterium]|nr:hypothetical protein [Oscillospiraceae bacterium]
MKKPLVIPRYVAKELERTAIYARRTRQCAEFFEKWLEKALSEHYDSAQTLDFFKNFDEFTVIKHGNNPNIEELENVINTRIDLNLTKSL